MNLLAEGAEGVFFCASLVLVWIVVRRSPAGTSRGPPAGDTGRPGWPRRRDYVLLGLFFVAVAVYGSLVPFNYRPLDFAEAVEQFKEVLHQPVKVGSRSNFVANILLFVPIGYCVMGVFVVDRRKPVAATLYAPLALLTCAAASAAIESAQLWFPGRYTLLTDMVAQGAGACVGVSLWLAVGQTFTDWVRSCTISQRLGARIDWLLWAYLIGLFVYSVLPLDLTISPADLVHKYREGRISVVPFSKTGTGWELLYRLLRDVVLFIPVGMLTATWLASLKRPVRSIPASVLLGALIVLAIEMAQLLTYSRFAKTGDLITGTIGVWVGACVMRFRRGRGPEPEVQAGLSRSARRTLLWLSLAGAYALFLVIVFCAPFEPTDDLEQLKARYEGFFSAPFARLCRGPGAGAVWEVLKPVSIYAPLGALLAMAVAPLSIPPAVRRLFLAFLLMAAAGVAASIEMAQVFLPPHVADVTDVLLCTAGAAIGMFVTARIAGSGRAAS